MKVGFGGARIGLTPGQKDSLRLYMHKLQCTELHHSDHEGGDFDAHQIALDHPGMQKIVLHPASDEDERHRAYAFKWTRPTIKIVISEPAERTSAFRYLVAQTEAVVVAPGLSHREPDELLWFRLAYAKELGKRTVILPPVGPAIDDGQP